MLPRRSESNLIQPAKRVLVVVYSQTTQLRRIVDRILAPLQQDSRISVHVETLRPEPEFPFPWPFLRFLDAFPESAQLTPCGIAPLSLKGEEDFDLVILPWQVWFLAPSQPITAFLKHPVAARLLAGKPVISIIACRNMWMKAYEKMLALLRANGANLVDNVVLTDRAATLSTLITTPLWLLTGKRDLVPGLPPAGIDEQDIHRSIRFGYAIRDALVQDGEKNGQPMLTGLDAVRVDPRLWASESAGSRSFHIWGRLLRSIGRPGSWQRKPFLLLYVCFLVAIIITIVPCSLAVQMLFRPLLHKRLENLRRTFEQPSGSSTERMTQYDF